MTRSYDFTYTVPSWGAVEEVTRTIQETTDEPEQTAIGYLEEGAIGITYRPSREAEDEQS